MRLNALLSPWLLSIASVAIAADPPAAKPPATAGAREVDNARLLRELIEERSLMLRLLEQEHQNYQLLLHYLTTTGKGLPEMPLSSGESPEEPATSESPAVTSRPTAPAAHRARPGKAPTAAVSGRVTVKGEAKDVFVFVEDIHTPPVKDVSLEIKQENKQFSPRAAVVQKGTKLIFTNSDAVFHNIFSVSPGNTFDLGTYRAGDPPKSIIAVSAGVIDLFCNLHSRMSSSILVTSNNLYARAGADGRYRIENVPVGAHTLTAWTPGAPAMRTQVDVPAAGAEVNLGLDSPQATGHTNKFGQPYGSYGD